MTREELIEFAASISEELKNTKKEAETFERWWGESQNETKVWKDKVNAIKVFASIL